MTAAHRAYRYRIYPSPVQERTLREWESALRWVWNHWVDQRRQAMRADKYFTAFEQTYELPALKRVYPWLASPPAKAYLAIADRLEKAWRACFEKRSKPPRFKVKDRDAVSISWDQVPQTVVAPDAEGRARLRFAKLGDVRVVQHRPLEGKAKSATISRERDEWYVVVVCEVAPPVAHDGPVVGIDRGVTDTLSDSEGRVVEAPKHFSSQLKRLARLQRRVSRRAVRGKPDSNRCKVARAAVARLHSTIARRRNNWLHHESRYYADRASHVVLEDLKVANMVRGNCARSILDQGWTTFANQLAQKMPEGRVVKVPAHYTSQTCAVCGVVDARSRKGKSFRCVSCGHAADADANAALEIQRRGVQQILAAQAAGPTARAVRDGARKRRNARSTGESRQKPDERERCGDAPVAVELLTAKCLKSGHNLGGNSGVSVPTRSGRLTLSQDASQPVEPTGLLARLSDGTIGRSP